MQYFGIDRPYQGARLPGGTKVADALYATLENDALSHADSSREMAIDLMCETENARGITFWQRQGFGILGQIDGKRPNQYHLMRRYVS
jgi:ribosomal protein S18 acetylase RimI-like enzyme